MKRMDKLSVEELKTIENDISARKHSGVEVKHSKDEIFVMGIKREGRWYDATLVNPQFILAQRRFNRIKRGEIDFDTTEDDLSIVAVDLSFVDLLCMCRFEVRDACESDLCEEPLTPHICDMRGQCPPPPPLPPMPECGLEDTLTPIRCNRKSTICYCNDLFADMRGQCPPPPPPVPECGLEEVKKRRRRGGRRHRGHRRA